MHYCNCCARTYGCDIQSMYMYLRDLRFSMETRQSSETVSRLSEYGHGVHYFHQTVWYFGSSAMGINRMLIVWKPDNLVLWQLNGHGLAQPNVSKY